MFAGERIKVLIVDDEPSILTQLARIAMAMGFDVVRASSAQEAIGEIDKADMLIADLKLNGDLTGGELVLDTWLSRRNGPCCVLTGITDREKEIDLIVRGADNVLWKPIPPAAIQAILNRYKRQVKDARLRVRLLHEIEELKKRISALEQVILDSQEDARKCRRRLFTSMSALGIALLAVVGLDASGSGLSDVVAKLISLF